MIGFVVRCGNQFKTLRYGWTTDVLAAVRFAREEDALQFVEAPDEHTAMVLMVAQWPEEVRDAVREAEVMKDKRAAMDNDPWWKVSRQARAMDRAVARAEARAQELCYELFKRSILGTVTPPAKA